MAKRLRACFRDMDTVARFGGDEFQIVFPADLKQPETATTLVSRLLEIISHPMDYNGQQIVSGVSIEVALSATDGDDADGLIKQTDLALYRAKAEGQGTFRFFEEVDARAPPRAGNRPSAGRDQNQLELHYRPQIDIFTDELVGFRSLVRWRHPNVDDLALGLHPAGLRRQDHRHRRMGPAPGMQRRAGVAELDQGGRQRIAGAVPGPASPSMSRVLQDAGLAEQAR